MLLRKTAGGVFLTVLLCVLPAAAARTGVGAVPRAQLEGWLQSHCRPLLSAVDAATMLDMLLRHTYGQQPRTRLPGEPYLWQMPAAISKLLRCVPLLLHLLWVSDSAM
jgi:hypothetical protein